MNVFAKVGEPAKPCPRCGATASVELYALSPPIRTAALAIVGALLLAGWIDRPRALVYSTANAIVVAIALVASNRARCRECGAGLVREAFGGWR